MKWNSLEWVLNRKGFDDKVISWIISSIREGKVCININGRTARTLKPIHD